MKPLICQLVDHDHGTVEVEVVASDFNRARWMVCALRSHAALRASLVRSAVSGLATLVDNTSLLTHGRPPVTGAHVVLWDGYNSLLELQDRGMVDGAAEDIVPMMVGVFPEVAAEMPSASLPLFDQTNKVTSGMLKDSVQVRAPQVHNARAWAQARLRPWRNWRMAPERHLQLHKGGLVVFCGLVQPSAHVLKGFLRGSGLSSFGDELEPMLQVAWHRQPSRVRDTLLPILDGLQRRMQPQRAALTGADWACAYSLFNVMQRMAVLSLLSAQTDALLVNEYTRQRHLDPYDAEGYANNVFPDFGSTRGPDAIYPRTVDMMLNGKAAENLRLLGPAQPLGNALEQSVGGAFWARCEAQVGQVLDRLAQLKQQA